MKRFEVYRNIRKKALIMGLSITFFAMMMTSVLGSLLVVIFTFSVPVILAVSLFNGALYIALTHRTNNPALWHFKKVFPQAISNKKGSRLNYEED